ncbi:MFS transporter [Pseudonocardia sp. NPDC049154]|uniref:MFS transporter n=1 Tax=Pseudonocardia sp. NPDC049154 TaxID=3155501 RepID=UPI003404C51B
MSSGERTAAGDRTPVPVAVVVLAGVNVCIGLGYGIAAPVIPLLAAAFDVSDLAASGVVSAYALARIVAAPAASRLAARASPAPVMAVAMAVTAVTSLLAGMAGSFTGLLVWRALGGAATVVTSVAGQTVLYRVAPAGSRGRATAVFHGGFLAGGLAGPLVGGVIAGVSLAAPLLVYGALLLLGGALAAGLLGRARRASTPEDGDAASASMSLREAWADRRFRVAVLTQFANAWIGNGLRFTVIPLFVAAGLGLGPVWTGLGLLLAGATQVLVAPVSGRLTDSWSRRCPLVLGGLAGGASALLLAIDETTPGYLAAMVLSGVAGSLGAVAGGALLGDVLDGRSGPPIAWYQIAFDVAGVVGPLASGAVAEATSYSAAFVLAAAVSVLSAVVAVAGRPKPAR